MTPKPSRAALAITGFILLGLLVSGVTLIVSRGGPSYHLVFADEFSGPVGAMPSSSVWTPETGGNGWGNHELECYTNSTRNVHLDGTGQLAIIARSDPGHKCSDGYVDNYTSARLQTLGNKSFEYGNIEVRAEMPTGSGSWPAIWMMGADMPQVNWPKCGEIDISEIVGSHPNITRASVHGPIKTDVEKDYTVTEARPLSLPSAGFHVYGISWQKNMITFTLDGNSYFTVTPNQTDPNSWPFNARFFMLLNLAVGGNLPGDPGPGATWPQRMLVDYVHVYQQ